MSITIVTVTYNSSTIIEKFFQSILNQDYPINELEIVIVDNDSPDKKKLIPILNKYKNLLPVKIIFRKNNLGFANSCNLGAKEARGNILFLNPDTELKKNSLKTLESHLFKENAKIAGGKAVNYKSMITHRTAFNEVNLKMMLLEFCNLGKLLNLESGFYINQNNIKKDIEVDGVGGGYMMIDSKVFQELRGFDQKYFMYLEDVDICKRAKANNHKIIYCPHSIIGHIGGASSNNKHRIAHSAWFNSREYYAKKHFNLPISLLLVMLYKVERALLTIRENIIR